MRTKKEIEEKIKEMASSISEWYVTLDKCTYDKFKEDMEGKGDLSWSSYLLWIHKMYRAVEEEFRKIAWLLWVIGVVKNMDNTSVNKSTNRKIIDEYLKPNKDEDK